MKINQLINFILILLICAIGIKSQETCENYNNQIHEATVVPRQIGVFKTLEITNAVSMTFNTNLDQYFIAELDTQQNEIRISTTESFANYEKDNNSTRTSLFLDIRCSSSLTASMTIRITINATNNYEPEFAALSYEIKIPTPLAKGTEITAYLGFDDQITATDYDLYDNRITFTLTGSNLFYVESVDVTGIKSTFKAKIFTSQQIIKLENDEMEFTLTATDSYFEPKSSSVKVKVFTDPENIFIESPKFSQPLYKGELEKGGNLKIEKIQLDESTYDDNVEFVIATDVYGIFNLTSVGPVIEITLKEGILPEEVFQQKFIDFIIEAKRDGDKSGFTVVVIDISSPIFTSSFEKSLYEGELKEKGQILSIDEMKLSTNGSLEETSVRLSQADTGYFDLSVNGDTVALTLKQDASIEEIMTKNLLFLTVDAIQNNTVVASTNAIIKTVSILIPQLQKNFYTATIENNQLQHESILITEASIDPVEEIEVSLVGSESLIFDAEINGREVQLKLKSGIEVPKDRNFLNVQIQVGVKSSTKKNSAIVICELKIAENPLEVLQFSSGLYEGKISQDLTLSLPEISLNIVENVDITLTGKHANYFNWQLNENKVVLQLKDGISVEQFSTDYYLQISIDASRENFTSATSSVIIGIERNSVVDSAFEKSLYIGSIDDQRTLQLENLIIKSDNIFTNVQVAGDDAEYFNASIQNNTIALNLIMNITEDLLLQKSILNIRIIADYEESSVFTNLIVTLPRPDEIKKLAFETSFTSGTILKETELILEIDEFTLNPSNYDDTVQFTLSGNDAQFFNMIQNSNKIQLKLNQNINEEQITSKKFLMLSVIASKEEFVSSEHFVFVNVEIFDSSESMFENTLYVGTVDDQRDFHIDTISIISNRTFNNVEIVEDDYEYFKASINQNKITVSLAKNITKDLLIRKSILSAKVVAKYDDIVISTKIIVTLPRPEDIKKLAFETTYTSGTIKKETEIMLEIGEFSLNPSNYDNTVKFTLSGTDADLFIFERDSNKIQLKLNQGITEEQISSIKFISISVKATREEFEDAEHFIFINVEIFNSIESSFESSLYVGYIDDQKDLYVKNIVIESQLIFSDVQIIDGDAEYFEASIDQNSITVSLVKNITDELLFQKTILSAKVVAQYNDISMFTNLIVTLPRPDETKKLRFVTSSSMGTIYSKDSELILNIGEISLNPSNYDDSVQFELDGNDAHLMSFDRNTNKIQLKLKQGISEEELNSKKVLIFSLIATREGFDIAEHFILINVEIFDPNESMFENALYVGTVDDQRDFHIDIISIISNRTFNNVEIVEDDYEYFKASINENKITVSLAKNITEDLLVRKSILSAKVVAKYDDIVISTKIIVTLPRPEDIKKLAFETTYTSGTIKKETEIILEISEFSLNPSNYDDSIQFELTGSDANLFSFEQDSNKIHLKLNQGVTEEQINSKKFLLLSMIATQEEFKDAEHFIFINVEIFDDSESTFENNLYMGQVDDQRTLHLDPINIKSERLFNVVGIIGDDSEYFNASITENQVHVSLAKEITQGLLIDKSILSAELMAQFDDIIITTNIIVALPRPDEIQSLKFEKSFSTGKIIQSDLNLQLDEIVLQTGNYNDNVQFILNGLDTDLFEMVRNANKIQLKLKSEVTSEMLNGKNLLSLTLKATRENFASAEHFVSIYIEKSSNAVNEAFDKSLYIGNIDNQNVLHVEQMTIKSDQIFSIVEITGNDSEYFDASIDQNNVTVRLKNAVDRIILPQKGFLNAQIVARHENISIYTNLIAELPDVDESQNLGFETPYTIGNLELYPQTKLLIQEIELKSANYDETVQFTISGSDANLFEISNSGYKVQLNLRSGINEESFENKEYFIITLEAIREGFESAEHFIFINILTPEIDESNFDQSLYLGSIDNQKVLHLNPLAIKSEQVFNEVMVADDDFEYFAASVDQNYVTITLIKEITENLLLKTSLLSTKVIAKSGDILISTNIIVTLPKVNPDKILRFESPYYIGTLDQLALDIEDIVLEISNYDETVEFTLSGSDKNLFKFERNQNSIKLSLASDITKDDLQNRVFLTASITATKNDFASAETVVFIHLNVIVDDITPIEFDKVIYTGSLTYDNVLFLDKIALASNETEIQISHKGDHADKFKINHSNLTDIKFDFIPQAIDFERKFYHFYIEALKFGTPRAYAAVIIEIVDKIQLKFDKVNYFGSFNKQGNLMIDQIPLNSVMTNPDVSFRLTDGQSEFFGLNSTGSSIKITKELTIAVENLNFVWFYLEAFGSNYYTARTLIVIDFPQDIDTPIDECYDKLDPTQPYFETGSYSFTIMSDETGLVGQIHAIITDPDDLISSYGLLFENIFLYDKITINKGDIKLLVPIPAGFYRMKGIALSLYSQKSAETSILLRVLETKACEDGKPVTTVQKSLAIVKIEENENHHQIMYMKIGDCNYEIIKVVPDALKSHLEIDNTTHYLKNIIQFDREDRIFANYSVPQLQVTLHLICPTSFSRSNSYSIQPFMNDIFTDEILYSPSITYLNLEILDQNDNAPIFTNPPNMNYRVAFPDEDLIALIMPKYLFKVEAYDIDDGLNAVIRYSTSMPSTFEINSVTGEINPLRTLPDEQTRLLITAIDREGAGLRATTSIEFIKISSSNVIEIVANNFAIKNVDELALEISEKLNADFRVLSSSQLPFTTNSQVLRFADTQAKTKIYSYAFKSNSLELITPNELMDQLKELDLSFSINYSTVDGCSHHNNNEGDCDLTVWIFVVSFMGTFILFILIAIPVFWYCYLKKKLLNKDSNSQSSKEEIANHFYDNDSVRDSDIASEIIEAITEMRASDADIVGIGVDGVTEGESSTDTEKLSNKLMSILEPSSPIHDRKVKFNEIVERIEVIDDPDPDTDETPKHKRY